MKEIDYKIALWAIEEARKAGADAVRAELLNYDGLNIQTEGSIISSLQQSQSHALVLNLYVNDRYGTFSTNSLQPETIRQIIRTGIASTKLLAPDADRTLPDPARYYKADSIERCIEESLALGNFCDDYLAQAPRPTEMAAAIARSIEGADPRIINVSANLGGRSGWQYAADSQGFEGVSFGSMCYAYTSVSLMDADGSRPSDGWVDYALSFKELNPLLARHAELSLEAAQHKIGASAIPAGTYTIAIEPVCIMKLLDPIIESMYGGSLYQHRSFLEGKLGEPLFSPHFNLREEPLRHGAFGATLFGPDGVATEPYDLIHEGRICTWLIGNYYANKMHCQPTHNTTSVLCLGTGQRSRKQILESQEEVLLITGFLGGNHNEVTGDFSYGIEGQLYRHGQRVQGVTGMNLTGNFLQFWRQLAETSSDVEKIPDGYFPLALFKDINLTK